MAKQKASDGWKYTLYAATTLGLLFAYIGLSYHVKNNRERESEESLVPVSIPADSLKPLSEYGAGRQQYETRQPKKQSNDLEQKAGD